MEEPGIKAVGFVRSQTRGPGIIPGEPEDGRYWQRPAVAHAAHDHNQRIKIPCRMAKTGIRKNFA
jgi:hypothetical protein